MSCSWYLYKKNIAQMAFIVAHSQILLPHAFQFYDTCNPAGSLHFSSLHKHIFLALLCEFVHPPIILPFPHPQWRSSTCYSFNIQINYSLLYKAFPCYFLGITNCSSQFFHRILYKLSILYYIILYIIYW